MLKCGTARRKTKTKHRPNFSTCRRILISKRDYNTTVTSQGHSEEKTTGKQLCTDVIRSGENRKKKYLFYIFSVRTDWKPTHHVLVLFSWRRFCRVDLKFDFPFFFFFFFREMYSSSPAMYISTSLSLGI